MMTFRPSLLALLALLLAGPAAAEAYKCRTADGRTEFSNTPCASAAATLKTVPDDQVSEADRQRAEREVQRMRDYVERREAAERAETAADRERQKSERQAASAAKHGRTTEDCLRDLDRQAWPAGQREAMEAACRNDPNSQPVYVPVAVPTPVQIGGNPLGACIQNIQRLNRSPAETSRGIRQCEEAFARPTHRERHEERSEAQPPGKPEAPAKPSKPARPSKCPPGDKYCVSP